MKRLTMIVMAAVLVFSFFPVSRAEAGEKQRAIWATLGIVTALDIIADGRLDWPSAILRPQRRDRVVVIQSQRYGYRGGYGDPYERAYEQERERLRRQEHQRWLRAEQERARNNARRDFFGR